MLVDKGAKWANGGGKGDVGDLKGRGKSWDRPELRWVTWGRDTGDNKGSGKWRAKVSTLKG